MRVNGYRLLSSTGSGLLIERRPGLFELPEVHLPQALSKAWAGVSRRARAAPHLGR